MTVYTVHEQPLPPVDRIDRAEAMVFLKDGFTWSAFVFGPIWLLANKQWLAALGYVVIAGVAYAAFDAFGVADVLFAIFMLALNLIVGFEAHWLRSARLEAKGWNSLGSITGRGRTECERRFFEKWLPSQAMPHANARSEATSASLTKAPASEQDADDAVTLTAPHNAKSRRRRGFTFFRRSRVE